MACPRCKAENREGLMFCEECGARLDPACPSCGVLLAAGTKFCGSCGTGVPTLRPAERFTSPQSYTPKHLVQKILTVKSALEGERKHVTILFCDIVNSIELAERVGPEAMHAVLNEFFELALGEVHRYEGTINQFLGDGFMALFGAPLAHEDHARRAVLAATGIQRRFREWQIELDGRQRIRLAVRMGLNTGPVVVGKIGDDLRMDYTAVGDATNLAARIEQVAQPDTILITEATRRLVEGEVQIEALEPVHVKGKAKPVPVYRLLGLRPPRSALEVRAEHALSPFVGRARELSTLNEILDHIEQSRGRVVGLVGDPGVGKSRLLYEVCLSLKTRGVNYLEGRCRSYTGAIPYLPIQEIVRRGCGIAEADSSAEIGKKVRSSLEQVGLNPAESLPYMLQLLRVREGTEPLDRISAETIKARIFETVCHLSLNGSRLRPLVVAVEDLQWIDRTSEECLRFLVGKLAGAPILLLTTYRPEYRPPWRNQPWVTEIVLDVLSPEDSRNLIQSIAPLDTRFAATVGIILDRAEGNPFFLEELTRVVAERGDLGTILPVPETIQGVLMARIDRLADGPRQVLRAASVFGREFSAHLLTAVLRNCEPDLAELNRLGFVYERSGVEGRVYGFKHALTQQVAYDSLLSPRRAALHLAAGTTLETAYADRLEQAYDRLAYHFARTDRADKAVFYLTRLAAAAAHKYAHVEAVQTLHEARAHVEHLSAEDRDSRIVELVLQEAGSLYFLGRVPEALDLLLRQQDRIHQLGHSSLAAAYNFQLGFTYNVLGDHEQAAQWEQRAIEEATRNNDQAILGKAHYVLAYGHVALGQLPKATECAQHAVSYLAETDERWWLGMAHWVRGLAFAFMGEFEVALEAEERANEIGVVTEDPRLVSFAAWTTGLIYATRGDWEAGVEACRRAVDRSPDPLNTAYASASLGVAYLEKGEAETAIPLLEEAIQQLNRFRVRQVHGWFTAVLSEAYLLRGELERARERATEGLEIAEATQYQFGRAWAERALGRIACARRCIADAEVHLTRALEAFNTLHARFEAARTHLALAELASLKDDHNGVRRHLADSQTLFGLLGAPRYEERTRRLGQTLGVRAADEAGR
jgi:class 3 adenylate cyclase/tetratricopeptide (TPR) repeat protein